MIIQSNLQTSFFNRKPALLAMVGISYGLMPVLGDIFGVLLIVIALGFLVANGYNARLTLGMWLVAQYIVIQSISIIFHEGVHYFVGNHGHYILFFLLLAPVGNMIQGLHPNYSSFEKNVGIGLVLAFSLIVLNYYIGLIGIDSTCRVTVYTGNPLLIAPSMLMVFFPLLYIGIVRNHVLMNFHGIILMATIVSVGAFMGARMAFYTMFLMIFILIFILMMRPQFQSIVKTVVCTLLAIILIIVIDTHSKCGFIDRITDQFENYPTIAKMAVEVNDNQNLNNINNGAAQVTLPQNTATPPAAPVMPEAKTVSEPIVDIEVMNAGGSRAVLWQVAYSAIFEKPFFGYGFSSETKLIAEHLASSGHLHFHNQYLSWLIWGGVISLLSGLALIFSPFFVFRNKVAALFFTMSWGLILFTDSLLISPIVLVWYIVGLLIYEKFLISGWQSPNA
jgi:hypothetical protein